MQTKFTAKRLFAAVLAVVMMLTAIPFSSFAADETTTSTTDYIVFGKTDKDVAIVWQVLDVNEDGSLLLTTTAKIGTTKVKYTSTDYDFATSNLFTVLNETFYNFFTDEEKAVIADTTVTYNNKAGQATVTAKVVTPTLALHEKYNFTSWGANNAYWFADYGFNSATNKDSICLMKASLNYALHTAAWFYRPVITLKAEGFAALPKIDGVTYYTADGSQQISYAPIGSGFTMALGENYADYSNVVVKVSGEEVSATDGVYTASASAITVEGVQGKPADYTAYDEAVASTTELVEEHYTAETWAALTAALAEDVADLTFVDQAKVDAAAAAITKAVSELKLAPADFTAYNAALEQAKYIIANPAIYNHSADNRDEGVQIPDNYINFVKKEVKKEAEILACTILDQAKVDEATAALEAANAKVPYMMATVTKWKDCVDVAAKITKDKYEADYVDAVQAVVAEEVAKHDYVNDPVDVRFQADVEASAQRMRDVIGDQVYIDSKLLRADFTALEAALERAATYEEANYYKDEDVERQEEKGGTNAWTQFVAMKTEAERIVATKANNPSKISMQKDIDAAVEELVKAMDYLDGFIKLDDWDRFVKDVEYFFSDLKRDIEGIIDLLKTVFSLLGMLFRGEIDLYGLVEMLGVDQEVLDFLISIGITPKDYIEPELPETPAA